MGDNQSKHSDVPNFLLETSLRSVPLGAMPPMIRVRVSDVKLGTTTTDTELKQSMRDRQSKG